jgi:BirA family biotin operon repressor/biotin-[acetyl-CoA-carboxylase] ligase
LTGDLSASAIERELDRLGAALGRPLSVVPQTGSTSDDAKSAAAEGAPHGATFVADAQSAGRGRGGHTWHSPPGENLYMSVVLRPRIEARAVAPVALVAGIAVARAVDRRMAAGSSMRIGIKWPNDLIAGGRKLCGVLVEGRLRGAEVSTLVVGVGVNVRAASFPEEIAARATSLRMLGCADLDRGSLAASILKELGEASALFEERGLEPFLDELARRDVLRGERVEVGGVRGVGEGIDRDGFLLVRDGEGALHRVASGEAIAG